MLKAGRGLVMVALVGVVGMLGLAGSAAAQDEGARQGEAAKAKPAPKQPEPPAAPEFTVTVDFPGGTVGQYIASLKEAANGHPVNVIASRSVLDMQVAPISLRDVTVYAAVQAVSSAAAQSGSEGQWSVHSLGNTARPEGYSLEYMSRQRSQQMTNQQPAGLRVFSMRDVTEPLPGDPQGVRLTKSPEVVLTAVRAALDLAGDKGGPAEMKFHEDSGLLIVHGDVEQIGAVDQTLEQIRDDVKRRRESARSNGIRPPDLVGLRMEMKKQQVLKNQAVRDFERTTMARDRAKKLADMGQVSVAELADLDARADEANSRLEMASIEMDRVGMMLEAAEKAQSGDHAVNAAPDRDPRAPAGRSVAAYELPPMDKAAREKLISAIMALEAAINNPEKLKLQSVQGESKIVIEADGAMHGVVRGMVREVAGARGREPEKSDDKPKGGR